ncbi:MAG: hypothetical protein ABJN40_22380 [Sneathiella sp.]
MSLPSSVSIAPAGQDIGLNDPIIEREDVMWAARKFILVYGDAAPDAVTTEINKLDHRGKLQVAAMFERIRDECLSLLKKSEKIRAREFH